MKKLFIILASCLFVFTLFGCSSEPNGVVTPNDSNVKPENNKPSKKPGGAVETTDLGWI